MIEGNINFYIIILLMHLGLARAKFPLATVWVKLIYHTYSFLGHHVIDLVVLHFLIFLWIVG